MNQGLRISAGMRVKAFPSPCGEKIVMNYTLWKETIARLEECFRPLAGKR